MEMFSVLLHTFAAIYGATISFIYFLFSTFGHSPESSVLLMKNLPRTLIEASKTAINECFCVLFSVARNVGDQCKLSPCSR